MRGRLPAFGRKDGKSTCSRDSFAAVCAVAFIRQGPGTSLGCSTAKGKGTCNNKHSIRRDKLETLVLDALRNELMDPRLFAEFCEEFTREVNRIRGEAGGAIASARAEIKKIDRDLEMLVNLILRGGAADKINAKMLALEARKKELEESLRQAETPPPLLHPNMALHYRKQLDQLYLALNGMDEGLKLQAREIIHSMLECIVVMPDGEQTKINIRGDLAAILSICQERKGRPKGDDKCSFSWLRRNAKSPPGRRA